MRTECLGLTWLLAISWTAWGQVGENVGRVGPRYDGTVVTPVNQVLTPVGRQLPLPGMRPQALALSPDGQLLVVSGKTSQLVVLDPGTGTVRQRVAMPSESQQVPPTASENLLHPDEQAQVSYTGLVFSPDGRRIFLSNVHGSVKVFDVAEDGQVTPGCSWPLPPAHAPRRSAEIPSGLAVTTDGSRLLVAGNLSNRLYELDTTDGSVRRQWDVGVAPYDVVVVRDKAFVSNWGGRRPDEHSLTGPAGRGTEVRVDPVRFIASEGSVSIVSLARDVPAREVLTGLHASGLAADPQEKYVVCANAASDYVSVIDVQSEQLVEKIWTKPGPADLFGASPNAVDFSAAGDQLYVANGTQNAVAVIDFRPAHREGSSLRGMIPVGWFPGALTFDRRCEAIYVANIKGLPTEPRRQSKEGPDGYNSHHYHGSVSLVPLPAAEDLAALSEQVARNLRRPSIAQAALPPRPDQPPRPIPERIGEPSVIRHVVYIIKENRTYDQVFGALERGRGRADLCVFGRDITPNQHKLVDEFVLLDNTYCAGILSADGHQWSTTAFSTDYMEKSFAGFPRSYPDGMGIDEKDALAYSPAGFLWDHAVLHGKSIRNYGEFMSPDVRWRDSQRAGSPGFLACYRTWKGETDEVIFASHPSIESIAPFSPTDYVGWEMSVPDQFRADFVIRELKEFESQGAYPELVLICLPNDHGSGTRPGCPTPAACMADNDLAFGRIVEALSHSRFWPHMVILAIEDDPQAGWDHVSGYRTTAYCIGPYVRRGLVVSQQYNTTSVLRTIEQILGLPPMNQFDASANPMFACFKDAPDLTPFTSVPNQVPLDQMNPEPQSIQDPILREDAHVSAGLNFRDVDRAPEAVLNGILWRAMKGTKVPYPEWPLPSTEKAPPGSLPARSRRNERVHPADTSPGPSVSR